MWRWIKTKVYLSTLVLAILACGTGILLVASVNSRTAINEKVQTHLQTANQTARSRGVRNLSLQPEAFKLSRRLGRRFGAQRRDVTAVAGTLIVGTTQRRVSVLRRQTDTGEKVEMEFEGELGVLSWNEMEGPKSSIAALSDSQRLAIERLVLDSPDQFVLAQLRGASYRTLDRNVRADEGGSDDYQGPLWDLIRVEEREENRAGRFVSNWRIYYLNVRTGLIDKVMSEVRGETIEAEFLEWTDQDGEKVPARIVWRKGEQVIQEFRLTTFANTRQE